MTLSEAIKVTRQKALMSQEDFAKAVEVSLASVNRWECGKSRPNLTAMKAIKKFCECNKLPYEDIEKEWISHSTEEAK